MIFKVLNNFVYAALSGDTTVQLSNGTAHKFPQISLFMKIHLPSTFILMYVRANKMVVHTFMILT